MTEKCTEQTYNYQYPQQLIKGKIFNLINEYFTVLTVDGAIYHQSVINACGKVFREDINKYLDSQVKGFLSLCENSPEKKIFHEMNLKKTTS